MRARFIHWDAVTGISFSCKYGARSPTPPIAANGAHFVSRCTMSQVSEVRQQLCECCDQIGVNAALGEHSDSNLEDSIMRCLLAGYPKNVAHLSPDGRTYRSVHGALELQLHPTSALLQRNPRPPIIQYDEFIMTSKLFARRASSSSRSGWRLREDMTAWQLRLWTMIDEVTTM
jgi:hypothetical protein